MCHLPNTLQTIADLAGVSRMTVSRVLRNQPNVKAAVRERVLKIASDIGYRPNPLISTLMADLKMKRVNQFKEIIAFVTTDPEGPEQWKESETTSRYYSGAQRRAAELGYRLEHFWGGDRGGVPAHLSNILHSRAINGVLLAPSHMAYRYAYAQFDWSKFAAATLGYTLHQPELHRACNNHFLAMRTALETLRSRGYTRIGLALSRADDNRVLNNWCAAYLVDQAMHMPVRQRLPVFIPDALVDYNASRPLFERWLERSRPDVVLSVHHPFFIDWIRDMGHRVPEDIGYADLDLSEQMQGHVSGMNQNSRCVGSAAVDLIIGQHHRNERGVPRVPTITSINGYWCDGGTVRV